MESVSWQHAFRDRLTGGITHDTTFVRKDIDSYFMLGKRKIKPSRLGFWIFFNTNNSMAKLINSQGEVLATRKNLQGSLSYDQDGSLVTMQDSKLLNLETGETQEVSSEKYRVSIPVQMSWKPVPDCSVTISDLGWISQHHCKSGPRRLLEIRGEEARYVVVCPETGQTSVYTWYSGEIENFHIWEDEVYDKDLWKPVVELLGDPVNLGVYSVHFSGMHSVMHVHNTELIFFYNLKKKVFTGLDTETGKVFPYQDFSTMINSSGQKRYRKTYFSTVGKTLHVFVETWHKSYILSQV